MVRKIVIYIFLKIEDYIRRCNIYLLNNKIRDNKGRIGSECRLRYPNNISIGKNTYVNGGYLFASENAKIIIGKDCLISYGVHMRTDTHEYIDINKNINVQGHKEQDIVIKDDVWIGFGAQIMAGVTINEGCVIGAGAIVTKDTEPYSVYAGIPAKLIKKRKYIG